MPLVGGPEVQFPLYFIRKLILLLFMKGYETDVGLKREGVRRGRGQKWAGPKVGGAKSRRGQKWVGSKVSGVKSGRGQKWALPKVGGVKIRRAQKWAGQN